MREKKVGEKEVGEEGGRGEGWKKRERGKKGGE